MSCPFSRVPSRRATERITLDRRLLRQFDFTLLLITLAIIGFGCAMIYSASRGGRAGVGYVERQILWAALGVVGAMVVASVDHSIYHRYAGRIYGLTITMLIAVFVLGHSSKGAQRWIGFGPIAIQPSEFAKIAVIICLAIFLVDRQRGIRTLGTFLHSLFYVSIPTLLIFKQPDLGTSLVLMSIWLAMNFVLGADLRSIALFVGVGAALGLIVWFTPGLLKDYQKARLVTFVNPSADPLGSGYHVTQSRIAIGSGRLSGKGFLKGTQRELNFIPEQHTDFIFTVVGEELGFVGAGALVLLYFGLLWRALNIMSAAEDSTGRAIAGGIVGMFLFHIFVNMGMTLGIMPVTGVPLPFFSYGGSSLMANMLAVGLLEGVSMRRHRITF